MSAEYVALLRADAGQLVPEPQQYRRALDIIRDLALTDRLTDEQIVAEIRCVFAALKRVQEDLDRAEFERENSRSGDVPDDPFPTA
ncbi:hypothetical protein [Actinoplanes sp. NPDC026670]|uniref:hypothetical protein n=1 Tax=Actinoplanes sp. NPDC026670 TaxID=3154700 RepID=UPI0033FC6C5F